MQFRFNRAKLITMSRLIDGIEVNVGGMPYEEVVVFFLDRPDADPQPMNP